MTRRLLYVSLALLLAAGAASADVKLGFHVNTAGIGAQSPSGGWLDFQFNQANAYTSLPATAVIDNFHFSSDYRFDPADAPPASFTLENDQWAANSFLQKVETWGTSFSFDVTLSGPAVGGSALYGSAFYLLLEYPDWGYIVAPGLSNEILNATIEPSGAVTPYTTSFPGGFSQVVPEPATLSLLAMAALALGVRKISFHNGE